jgi:hypothetical protein
MTAQPLEVTTYIDPSVAELGALFNITIAKPESPKNIAMSYLDQHREVGTLLAAVLVAQEERIQNFRLEYETDQAARQGMSEAELKMLPDPKQLISVKETYAPRWRVHEIIQGRIKRQDTAFKSAETAGLITDVLSYDSSGDSHVVGYRVPARRREEVVALLLKWKSSDQ